MVIIIFYLFIVYLVPEPLPLIFNKSLLTENEVIFAHVFFEGSDKLLSFLSSICGKFVEMEGIIVNIMKENEIDPLCFINFKHEDNCSSAQPFSSFFKKRTNLKTLKKFSIIILSVNLERKIKLNLNPFIKLYFPV